MIALSNGNEERTMRRLRYVFMIGLWLLATACTALDVGVETPTAAPTLAPNTNTPAPEPSATPAPQPTVPAAGHPLEGLVYTIGAGNGLWRIGADGTAQLLTDQHYPTLSPDQTRVLYAIGYEGDIWLKELPDGLGTNLTNTSDQLEEQFWWWPGNPNVIVFHARTEAEGPFGGSLGLMQADGSGYQLLEGTSPFVSPPALSPDGQTIAFDKSAEPWLYSLGGSSAQALDIKKYNLGFDKATYPAWSPDGSKLAWKVYGNGQSAVAIVDLAADTAQVLHPYTLTGGTEIFAELAWSPDGQWLAVVNQLERPGEDTSLWVLRADGSAEQYLGGRASSPAWSPDGQSLVFSQLPDSSSAFDAGRVQRVRVGEWQAETLDLPGGAQVEQWFAPIP
jgi:hypothetical protein